MRGSPRGRFARWIGIDDAYSAAAWLRRADRDGTLAVHLTPSLSDAERVTAELEGWILGVS